MNLYFLYDPSGDGFQTFNSQEARDAEAKKIIAASLDDGDDPSDVGLFSIVAGQITHAATRTRVVKRPAQLNDEGEDDDGDYWPDDCEEKFDVELLEIGRKEGTHGERSH